VFANLVDGCSVVHRRAVMIKVLEVLLGGISRERSSSTPAATAHLKRSNSGDFRAVKIAPSVLCCGASLQASEKSYLLREAPRLPLMGCTMPVNCSCKFRKTADRRGGDRRLLGAGTSRWFAGVENRQRVGRRSEK
jgi:hypothetical protein